MSTRTLLIRKVFRTDDEDAVTVLRLVAAANDLGILWRMLMLYVKQEGQGAFRRTLSASAYRYACRMGTLHLPDAWRLINSGDFRRVEQRLARRNPDVSQAAQQFKIAVNREPLRSLVADVRNTFAGHLNEDAMQRALSSLAEDGLMDVPIGDTGHGDHFTVTDRIFDAALIEGSHAKYAAADAEESLGMLLEEMSEAQRALRDLATTLVVAMYLDNVT